MIAPEADRAVGRVVIPAANNPWVTLNATRMAGESGIVGMWQWPGGALILTIRPDNTFTAGPISGRWQAANLGDRTYTLIWPPPIHTGTLAPADRSSPAPTSTGISSSQERNRVRTADKR